MEPQYTHLNRQFKMKRKILLSKLINQQKHRNLFKKEIGPQFLNLRVQEIKQYIHRVTQTLEL